MSGLYRSEACHYPRSLPVLREFGAPVEPTEGDVAALIEGCRRLLAGKYLTSTGRDGERVEACIHGDYGVLRINGVVAHHASNAYDLAVLFYAACWRWQVAWDALEGRS